MKKLILLFLLAITNSLLFSQAVKTSSGNWDVATNWSGSNIGDVVTETVTINQNQTSTILNGETYTINNLLLNQNDKLYVNLGGTLNVGNATHPATFTTDQNNELYIDGNFTIWGNTTIPQNINITIKGTLTIKGKLTMSQNANIIINTGGKFIIGGDFVAGQNTNVNISGTGSVKVSGNINVDHGSNLNSPAGGFQFGGTCNDNGANFCSHATSNPALPIKLLYFTSEIVDGQVILNWATATEKNFDKFIIERSTDSSLEFISIGEVSGHGNSSTKIAYSYTDQIVASHAYYRLKSVDYDYSFEYSNVVIIDSNAPKSFTVYPNPLSGNNLKYTANFETSSNDMVVITDQMGNTMLTTTLSNNEINMPSLQSGVYFVRLNISNYNRIIKLIIK